MYAETVLQLSDRKDVLVVPMEAVVQNAGEARILVVNGQNIVEERKVKLGAQGKSVWKCFRGCRMAIESWWEARAIPER